jgi:indole-3-glycerol phosphate synthase
VTRHRGTILDRIVAHKREETALRRRALPQVVLEDMARQQPPALGLAAALREPGVQLIAEVKRASPSRGLLRPDLDPGQLAQTYASHGAAAISVLTDRRFFQGSAEDLMAVKDAVTQDGYALPVLRKGFILEPYQVYEARAWRADALLLIAAAVGGEPDRQTPTRSLLVDLLALTRELGMEALLEVHSVEELDEVMRLGPRIVGINNRNLRTFEVNLETTLSLRSRVPPDVVVISESGVREPADVRRLAEVGVDAVLVGETLVTAKDVGITVQGLVAAGAGSGRSHL